MHVNSCKLFKYQLDVKFFQILVKYWLDNLMGRNGGGGQYENLKNEGLYQKVRVGRNNTRYLKKRTLIKLR